MEERWEKHREQDRRRGREHPSADLLLSTETERDPVGLLGTKAFPGPPFLTCRVKASSS